MDVKPVIFVISGDSKGGRKLAARLKHLGYRSLVCRSLEDFQKNSSPHDAGCILLHGSRVQVRAGGHAETQSYVDFDWLAALGPQEDRWPVIAIAPAADVDTAVLTMKRGAFDFLLESCSERRLREAIEDALRWDASQRKHIAQVQSIRRRTATLTAPYRAVLDLLLEGKSNREIADLLGMSVRSIEVRRAKVMQTMKARSLVSLVRKALLAAGLTPSRGLPPAAGDRAADLHSVTGRPYGPPPK